MDTITLLLTGDVMTGRGIDQVLPHPGSPQLFESHMRDARDYVRLAEQRAGRSSRPATRLRVGRRPGRDRRAARPTLRIVNLETAVTHLRRSLARQGHPLPHAPGERRPA